MLLAVEAEILRVEAPPVAKHGPRGEAKAIEGGRERGPFDVWAWVQEHMIRYYAKEIIDAVQNESDANFADALLLRNALKDTLRSLPSGDATRAVLRALDRTEHLDDRG
jgi:hypothetical protein